MSGVAFAADDFAAEGPLHILLKAVRVLAELGRGLVVQWVVGVGLQEEENQSHDHIADVKDGFPVRSQNIQANVAFHIDVGVVNICVAVDHGCFVGVLRRHPHREVKLAPNPQAVLLPRQVHRQSELHYIRWVNSHLDETGLVQVLQVLGQADLPGTALGRCSGTPGGRCLLFFLDSLVIYFLLAQHFFFSRNTN